jgi:hypothetical protein
MPDPYDPSLIDVLSGGSQDDARALASAMASQLRRKQLLAEMGATVPALAGTAKLQAQDVGEQQKQLEQAGAARLHYGNEAMALKQSLEQAKMQNALTNTMLRGQYGLRAAEVRSGVGAGGVGGALTPEALDIVAENFAKTGTMPPMGMGTAGAIIRKQIMNRAAELHPGTDLASSKAGYGADTQSLRKLQQMSDAVDAFENTAGKNLDQFLGTAQKVVDSGSPLLNQPLRSINQKVLGGQELAAFNAARQVALTEVAKVLTNPNLAGQLTDQARKEVEGLMGPNITLGQAYAVAKILKTDMANRKTAVRGQLDEVRKRIGTKPGEQPAPEEKKVLKWNPEKGVAE